MNLRKTPDMFAYIGMIVIVHLKEVLKHTHIESFTKTFWASE